ncbi:unnamed protein product [Amoebophrya sp. A120]|nr:unnamed protein product [Amoebophrya sp. A120]|eukprot:GSA120T00003026001.1
MTFTSEATTTFRLSVFGLASGEPLPLDPHTWDAATTTVRQVKEAIALAYVLSDANVQKKSRIFWGRIALLPGKDEDDDANLDQADLMSFRGLAVDDANFVKFVQQQEKAEKENVGGPQAIETGKVASASLLAGASCKADTDTDSASSFPESKKRRVSKCGSAATGEHDCDEVPTFSVRYYVRTYKAIESRRELDVALRPFYKSDPGGGNYRWEQVVSVRTDARRFDTFPKKFGTEEEVEAVYGPIVLWDVSGVRNFSRLFQSSTFNRDIRGWDVAGATTMAEMFSWNFSFDQPIGEFWDVGKVKTMRRMFEQAHAFNQPLDSWDTGSVVDMTRIFGSARSFNQHLDKWSTANVVSLRGAFQSAPAFNGRIGHWDVAKVTSLRGMFESAWSFNKSIGKWNVINVQDMTGMFGFAYAFNQPLASWNVTNVKSFAWMFSHASSFNQNLQGWRLRDPVDRHTMFYCAHSYQNGPLQPADGVSFDDGTNAEKILGSTIPRYYFPDLQNDVLDEDDPPEEAAADLFIPFRGE